MKDDGCAYVNEGQDTELWQTYCPYGCAVEINGECEHGFQAGHLTSAEE